MKLNIRKIINSDGTIQKININKAKHALQKHVMDPLLDLKNTHQNQYII